MGWLWERTKTATWYAEIFLHYSSQYLKSKMTYRSDFLINIFSDFFLQSMNLIFIFVLFDHIPTLKGWTKEEMMFVYGFFLVPFGFYSGFFNHLFDVPEKYVLKGELDRVLVRPMNSLFQVIVETMRLELVFGVFVGMAMMAYAGSKMNLAWTWWDIPLGIILVIGSTFIYGGVYTLLASLGFWFEGRMGLMPMVYNISNYGRYPTDIYKGVVRFILTWVLPFAFVGFYPATVLMKRQEYYSYGLLTPVVGLVFWTFSYIVWTKGIKRYSGTGS